MAKVLTITVPTYNVEKYLRNCLDSFIIPEIMDDLEVLIVNDGSTDSSAEIAQEYVDKYPATFFLINKENGGHGSTINMGIARAKGTWFKVVDSDDWVDGKAMQRLVGFLKGNLKENRKESQKETQEKGLLETQENQKEILKEGLQEIRKETDVDLVFTNYNWVNHRTGEVRPEFSEPFQGVVYEKVYRFKELPEGVFLKMHGFTVRTELLRKIPKIDEHCFYVDMEYVLFPVPYIQTICFLPDLVYQYRIGMAGQSMNPEKMRRNAKNYDRVMERLFRYYDEWSARGLPTRKKTYFEHVLARMFASRVKIYLGSPYSKKLQKELKERDQILRKKYPAVYRANVNRPVKLLRITGYRLLPLAGAVFRRTGLFSAS